MRFSSLETSYGARALSVSDVSVTFGALAAISEVSLSVERSRILGLIGPNGAGKTTLVNCLTGFLKPTSGAILLGDSETARWNAKEFRRAGISRTFQAGRLFKEMSVLENVEVTAIALGGTHRQSRAHALEILGWIGLGDKTAAAAGALPYTDERRVGLARALVGRPAFVLMDEPAAGMSDHECEALIDVIRQVPELFGCGVLLIEHNMHLVMNICHQIHVLDGGRTLAEGTPNEIKANKDVISAYLGDD